MEEIWFDGIGAREGFGLLCASEEVNAPEPRTYTVKVPGRDGSLDLSACLGRLYYEDRTAKFTFLVPGGREQAQQTASAVRRALHGKTVNIARGCLPGCHLTGRVSAGPLKARGGGWFLTLTCTCEPFYYADSEQTETFAADEAAAFTRVLRNGGNIPVTPVLTVTGSAWTVNGTAYAAGIHTADFALEPGENTVTAASGGAGSCVISFREAML